MKSRTNEAKWIPSAARWQINIMRDTRRRTFVSAIPGTPGKIDAEKKADKWIAEGNAKDLRFQKAWDDFIADQKARTGKGNWKQREFIGRRWLLPEVKHKRISAISNQDWQDIINKAYRKGLSKKYLCNIRGAVYAFYKYMRKRRVAMVEPEDIIIPSDAPVGVRKVLQPGQLQILFSQGTIERYYKEIPCFFIHAWRFQVLTGMRPGEVYGLREAEDINGSDLSVHRSINRYQEITGGKNPRARRHMRLTGKALAVLEDQKRMLLEKGIESPWVFPGEDGEATTPAESYNQWLVYRSQHGIVCSLYELRHSMISLAKSELPEPLLKLLVGHGVSMDTIGVYGHEIEGDLQRAAEILEGVFKKVIGGGNL